MIALRNNLYENTWLASRFRWQIRTFWFALLWTIIGSLTLIIWVGGIILLATAVWVIYRAARGWLCMNDAEISPNLLATDNKLMSTFYGK